MARTLSSAFGARVRHLREEQGYSQEGFADLCGLHRTYVGGIERGERNPTLKAVATLARALKMSMSELLDGVDGK